MKMSGEQYLFIMNFLKGKKYAVTTLYVLGKVITYFTALSYIGTILWLVIKEDMRVISVIFVPAVSFILVSFFRKKYNAKRPYEIYNFKPLIPKDTKGKSFPSRHVFSIYMCGGAVGAVFPALGIIIYVMGIFLAVIRVVTGVHFPKDVAAGAFIGILCGIAGFI